MTPGFPFDAYTTDWRFLAGAASAMGGAKAYDNPFNAVRDHEAFAMWRDGFWAWEDLDDRATSRIFCGWMLEADADRYHAEIELQSMDRAMETAPRCRLELLDEPRFPNF